MESNCAGATPPGGEQLEMNDQSVTPVNSIRSAVLASLLSKGEARAIACVQRAKSESRRDENRRRVGDGMTGSSGDVNQGTTAGGPRAGRGQSPRRSEEAGNDRGAKGGRDAVWDVSEDPSPKGPGSAARLCARMRRESGPGESWRTDRGPPAQQVSGAQAGAAGATPPTPGVECLSQSIGDDHELESWMRENRPSSLGGGRRCYSFSIHITKGTIPCGMLRLQDHGGGAGE